MGDDNESVAFASEVKTAVRKWSTQIAELAKCGSFTLSSPSLAIIMICYHF